ncbi:MAG TPA: hypothetical protein PKK56_03185 [archaeon]|jgi:hypothetical protein|nr:hypothetical protein [archaeon]
MKNIHVILSPEAEEIYKYLNEHASTSKIEQTILNTINKKIELIKTNFHYGEPIAKKLIPQEYKEKYDITNLFWVELPNFWRMLYTLTNDETNIEIIAFILDIIDHDTYNKKFKYRKK